MNEYIFKRREEKYLLTKHQKDSLLDNISTHIEKDQYFNSKICTLYFDNDNHDLIINSLEKPPYKDKVRLRSYGIPQLDDYIYLEIKNKYKRIVGKRRIKLKLKDYYNYLEHKTSNPNSQIMKEINYLFHHYNLKPQMYISYDRKSYQ